MAAAKGGAWLAAEGLTETVGGTTTAAAAASSVPSAVAAGLLIEGAFLKGSFCGAGLFAELLLMEASLLTDVEVSADTGPLDSNGEGASNEFTVLAGFKPLPPALLLELDGDASEIVSAGVVVGSDTSGCLKGSFPVFTAGEG